MQGDAKAGEVHNIGLPNDTNPRCETAVHRFNAQKVLTACRNLVPALCHKLVEVDLAWMERPSKPCSLVCQASIRGQSTSKYFGRYDTEVENAKQPAMSPRLSLWNAGRSLAIRAAARPSVAQQTPLSLRAIPMRSFADQAPKPNTNPSSSEHLPQVSEEASQYEEVVGGTKPDLEQGTPVQEVHALKPKAGHGQG